MKRFKSDGSTSSAKLSSSETAAVDIDALPLEMLGRVLSFLALSEQLKIASVSRRWQQAVDDCLARRRHFSPELIPGMDRVSNQMLEKTLSRLPGLRSLDGFRGDDLDVDIVARHCPQLVKACLYTFRVDVPSLERLCSSCLKLAELSLPGSCDDACIEAVLRGLPKLRSLCLNIWKTSGRFLALLPASLQRLELSGGWNMDPAELDRAARCPDLTELDISGVCRRPSGELVKLLQICPRLERLNANGSGINDVFMEQLPDKAPNIRYLYIEGCVNITVDGLKNLRRLKELRKLNVMDTYTNDAVVERLQGAFHLTELAIGTHPFNGPDCSVEALARLVVSCPSLRLLVPSDMVHVDALVDCLAGQLTPDRDVSVMVGEGLLDELEVTLPEDGPLKLVPDDDAIDDLCIITREIYFRK